jgi:hypothetical protein
MSGEGLGGRDDPVRPRIEFRFAARGRMARHDNSDGQPGIAASLVVLCHDHHTTSPFAAIVVSIVAVPVISAAGLFCGAERRRDGRPRSPLLRATGTPGQHRR